MKNKLWNIFKNFFRYHIYIIPLLLALDIGTKLGFEALLLANGKIIEVIPNFFYLGLSYNPGGFSGMLGGIPFGTEILMVCSIIGGIFSIAYLAKKFHTINLWLRAGLFLFIPGCLGNLYDRFLYVFKITDHGVIDFLEFHFGETIFPNFNVADICLTTSIFVIGIGLYLSEKQKEKASKEEKIHEKSDV